MGGGRGVANVRKSDTWYANFKGCESNRVNRSQNDNVLWPLMRDKLCLLDTKKVAAGRVREVAAGEGQL